VCRHGAGARGQTDTHRWNAIILPLRAGCVVSAAVAVAARGRYGPLFARVRLTGCSRPRAHAAPARADPRCRCFKKREFIYSLFCHLVSLIESASARCAGVVGRSRATAMCPVLWKSQPLSVRHISNRKSKAFSRHTKRLGFLLRKPGLVVLVGACCACATETSTDARLLRASVAVCVMCPRC